MYYVSLRTQAFVVIFRVRSVRLACVLATSNVRRSTVNYWLQWVEVMVETNNLESWSFWRVHILIWKYEQDTGMVLFKILDVVQTLVMIMFRKNDDGNGWLRWSVGQNYWRWAKYKTKIRMCCIGCLYRYWWTTLRIII